VWQAVRQRGTAIPAAARGMRKEKTVCRGIVCILFVLIAPIASADELAFNNGDRLTGTVVKLADGKVTFKSAVAGEVTSAVTEVRSLSTARPVKIVLPDRSVVNQQIFAGEAGRVRIGGSSYPLADIRAINPPAVRWGGKASLGLSLINATKDTKALDFLLNLARSGARDRIAVDAAYLYARSESDTTTNTWFINGDYNFARRGRVYALANGRVQQDRIQHLDLRSILGGGIGYIASERPDFSFRAEGGLAWVREDFSTVPTRSNLAPRLGYLLEKTLWKSARLKHDFTIYPKLSDWSDYYLLTQVILEQVLSDSVTIDARFIFDHTSKPAPNVKKSTSKLILAVGKTF
jgi:hypothetical protein